MVSLAGAMTDFTTGMGKKHLVAHDFQGDFIIFSLNGTDKSVVANIGRTKLLTGFDGSFTEAFGAGPGQSRLHAAKL